MRSCNVPRERQPKQLSCGWNSPRREAARGTNPWDVRHPRVAALSHDDEEAPGLEIRQHLVVHLDAVHIGPVLPAHAVLLLGGVSPLGAMDEDLVKVDGGW